MPLRKALPVLLVLAFALGSAPAPGQGANALGVTPPAVEVEGAQPGQAYQRTVTVQNQFDTATVVTLEPMGDVGNWTTTSPASGFQVPPRSNAAITLSIAVPTGAEPGLHQGHLRLVAEPKEQPSGSGFALRYAVAVVLNVTVGGEPIVRLRWTEALAEDVEAGSPPAVFARVANEGNVRTTARAEADVLPIDADRVLLHGTGAGEVVPGQAGTVALEFPGDLPVGQYRARVRSVAPGGFESTVEFQVLERGQLGKKGVLKFLEHEPWVDAGLPVKVTAVFENTGKTGIGRAKFSGEVYLDTKLVGVLASDELVAPVGALTNLTAFFTPTGPGVHRIVGKVTYDGLQTVPSESLLNVRGAGGAAAGDGGLLAALGQPGPGGVPRMALLGGVGAAALLCIFVVLRRR